MRKALLTATLATAFLYGCGSNSPTCDGNETRDTVLKIATENNFSDDAIKASSDERLARCQFIANDEWAIGWQKVYKEDYRLGSFVSVLNRLGQDSKFAFCYSSAPMGKLNYPGCGELWEKTLSRFNSCKEKIVQWQQAAQTEAGYSLKDIRLTHHDENTSAETCAATLQVKLPENLVSERQIQYKVEKTTDGKIFVSVF